MTVAVRTRRIEAFASIRYRDQQHSEDRDRAKVALRLPNGKPFISNRLGAKWSQAGV